MTISLLVGVLVAATSVPRVASVGFRGAGVDEAKAQFFSGDFALQLREAAGVSVVTPEEIGAVLGLERQQQLLGCADSGNSCLAELAGGLGAQGILQGTVARIGDGFALTVKIIDAKDASVIAARSGQFEREADVLPWLAETARRVAGPLRERFNLPPLVAQPGPAQRSPLRTGAWAAGATGLALAITGAVLFGLAHGTAGAVAKGDAGITSASELEATLGRATTFQTGAVVSWSVAAAALATSAALWAVSPADSNVSVSGWLLPGSGGLAVRASW